MQPMRYMPGISNRLREIWKISNRLKEIWKVNSQNKLIPSQKFWLTVRVQEASLQTSSKTRKMGG